MTNSTILPPNPWKLLRGDQCILRIIILILYSNGFTCMRQLIRPKSDIKPILRESTTDLLLVLYLGKKVKSCLAAKLEVISYCLCDQFQRDLRGIFLSFQGGLRKMYRIYREILHWDKGDFRTLAKSVCFRRSCMAQFREIPEDQEGITCMFMLTLDLAFKILKGSAPFLSPTHASIVSLF